MTGLVMLPFGAQNKTVGAAATYLGRREATKHLELVDKHERM